MPAFGRAFFARLFAEFPSLAAEAVFRRWSVQPDDVYATFGRFVIQIDPDLEYIIVSGGGRSGEYGDWGDNDRAGDARRSRPRAAGPHRAGRVGRVRAGDERIRR